MSSIERMTITMPADMAAGIKAAVESGDYASTSEVVRDGLRLLETRAAEDAARLARLQAALAEAEDALARGDFHDVQGDALDAWLDKPGADAR
jgi:antitoxin ParD1/3/4